VLVSLKSLLKGARYGHLADGVVIKNGKRERRLELAKDNPTPDEIKRLLAVAKGTRPRALLLTAALTRLGASRAALVRCRPRRRRTARSATRRPLGGDRGRRRPTPALAPCRWLLNCCRP
jgi:hypothetical protein